MRFLLINFIYLQLIWFGCNTSPENKNESDLQNDPVGNIHTTVPGEDIPVQKPVVKSDSEINREITDRLNNFLTLLPENPKAAREQIAKIGKLRYGDHPLVNEWVEYLFRFSREGKALILELVRQTEIEIQILTDIDAEKHAEEIATYQKALKRMHNQISKLKDLGIDPKIYKVNYKLRTIDPENN